MTDECSLEKVWGLEINLIFGGKIFPNVPEVGEIIYAAKKIAKVVCLS